MYFRCGIERRFPRPIIPGKWSGFLIGSTLARIGNLTHSSEANGTRTRNHRIDSPVYSTDNRCKSDPPKESAAFSPQNDASDSDLAFVMSVWSKLPEAVKADAPENVLA